MNKNIIKIFLGVLSLMIVVCFVGCKKEEEQKETKIIKADNYEGVHIIKTKKTDKMITKDGKCNYQIIIPDEYSKTLFQAASELRLFINLASNCSIEIIKLSEYRTGNYVSLVDPKLLLSDYDENNEFLGATGYRIKTIDNNVYIIAKRDPGVLNGVYGFLESAIGFNVYAYDEIVYNKGDIELLDFDIVDIPDIEYRVGDVTNKIDGDSAYRTRLKLNCNDDVFAYVNGTLYHNSLYYFPVEKYGDVKYQDWYSENGGVTDYKQLCYSAHGNEEKLEEMLDVASNLIVLTLKDYTAETITFMQSDVNSWCNCPICKAYREKYGTDAAVLIIFLNKLVDAIDKKLAQNNMENRKYNICFFAYQKTEEAPVARNADGSYAPIDESVILKDNICVYYAPIYASYNQSFEGDNNKIYADTLKAWNAIAKECFVWFYQTNFSHYLYPYNSLPTMQERYNYIANQNAKFVFDQNQWDQGTKTSFHRLKAWMNAKLSWDVNLDYEELLDDYFSHYFYDAALSMRKLFDEMTFHMEYLAYNTDMSGDIYYLINQHKYFPKALLDNWMNLIDESYQAVKKYKESDPRLYEKLVTRIGIESMSIRFMNIELYASRYSPERLRALQNEFMQDCFKYGIDKVAELTDIQTVFEQWGIL